MFPKWAPFSVAPPPQKKNIANWLAADVQAQLTDLASNNEESEGQINTSEAKSKGRHLFFM